MKRLLGILLVVCGLGLFAIYGFCAVCALANVRHDGLRVVLGLGLIAAAGLAMAGAGRYLMTRSPPIGSAPVVARTVGRFTSDVPRRAELAGRPYTVLYQMSISGKWGRPSLLRVSVPAATPFDLSIGDKDWFDRLCRWLGLAREIRTGDSVFAERCFVRTDRPASAADFLRDPVRRAAVLDVRRLGFAEVILGDGEIQANWPGFDPLAHDRPGLEQAAAARLVVLAEGLAQRPTGPSSSIRRWVWEKALGGLLVVFAATCLFGYFHFEPVSGSECLLASLPLVVAGLPAFGWIAAWALRGATTSKKRWLGLMAAALVLFPMGAMGTTALVNGYFDLSAPGFHHARIVEKAVRRGKGGPAYYVVCTSWNRPGETIEFLVSPAEYERVVVGRSEMHITTSAGRLGIEWMRDRRLVIDPLPHGLRHELGQIAVLAGLWRDTLAA